MTALWPGMGLDVLVVAEGAEMTCEVCNGESGGTFVGVAAVPGIPMSIGWCSECLRRDSAPSYVFKHDFIFVAEGDVTKLHPCARSRQTWADGGYITFDEYVKRITPEMVQADLDKYAEHLTALAIEENAQ